VRIFAHECTVQLYRSLKTLPNEDLMWSQRFKEGTYPTLTGVVYPWIFGDD